MDRYIGYIQNVINFLGMVFCAILIFTSSPPSISDLYECTIHSNSCNHEETSTLFYIFSILFAATTLPILLVVSFFVRRNWKISEEITQDHRILLSMAKEIAIVLSKDEFEKFYEEAIFKIKQVPQNTKIRATSSFTPPDENMRNKYFSSLAAIINKENSAKYQVIIAKGDIKDDKLTKEAEKEIRIRINHLDSVKNPNGTKRSWVYGSDFTIRQSRYHARMDFLIVLDTVFINASTSGGVAGDRGYIRITDDKCAEIFKSWFDALWDKHSNRVDYDAKKKVVTFFGSKKVTMDNPLGEERVQHQFRV